MGVVIVCVGALVIIAVAEFYTWHTEKALTDKWQRAYESEREVYERAIQDWDRTITKIIAQYEDELKQARRESIERIARDAQEQGIY